MRRFSLRAVGVLLVALTMGTLLSACGGGTYSVTATFDDVGDLQKSGAVQVADVRVGKISSIKLTDDFRAKVSMAIEKSVHIPKNSEALVRTTSLLGEKFVELRPPTATRSTTGRRLPSRVPAFSTSAIRVKPSPAA